jgi:hypothetical protein
MVTTTVVCARCGRDAPGDPDELLTWRHGELAIADEVEEGLLVCPDCDAEHRELDFEEGGD